MLLKVVIVLVLAVQFCKSTRNINRTTKSVAIEDPNIDRDVEEDSHLSTTELISKYGYPAEKHSVVTKDGYILGIDRIKTSNATPVLLVHGFLDASSTWVLMGPNQGFAYLLHDQGYDVWMMNVRGNTHSRNHTTLNPNNPAFWNFTFHEIGFYDIPATIDYILQETNFEKLQYIGHSQGGGAFFIMCSLRPEYNRKIISMQALAPGAFVANGKSALVKFLAYFADIFVNYLNSIGIYEILPNSDLLKLLANTFCRNDQITQLFCINFIFLINGFDMDQTNQTMLPVILGHTPAGGSSKTLLHYVQLQRSGRFSQFDYGKMRNLQIYKRRTPPDYDLKKVTSKVALHYSPNDYLVDPKDIEILRQALPNVVGKYLVNFPKFNHLDFIWAIDARKLVYYKVIKLMRLIQNGEL